jgi:putative spermidine/putrescine transport system substrate-binding protein
MNWHRIQRFGLVVGIVTLVATACGGTTTATTSPWATATSAAGSGGMDALVKAAQAEGTLNVIALPPDWTNYGAIISAFSAKYGIAVNSANPNGGSQDELNAIKTLGKRGPDVVDVGTSYGPKNLSLFAPYQVSNWSDVPSDRKEPTGLWVQDYGGYMSIGYDSAKVPAITSINDLLGPKFKSKVALAGVATASNQAVNSIMMVSLVNGGTLDDISKGVDWFHTLKQNGNWIPSKGTTSTVKAGDTPVLFEWDYLSQNHVHDVPTWRIWLPTGQVIGSYYEQAISKTAPHPAAARLWEEYIFSAEAQNLYLKGGARPIEVAAMTAAGTIDKAALAALPEVKGTPVFMTDAQSSAASAYIAAHWAQAIG